MITFYEALEPGMEFDLGSHTFEADAIKAFAMKYDPQRFHVDESAAKSSVFGALCASGWHTVAIWMRLNIEHGRDEMMRLTGWQGQPPVFGPSPGVRDIKWLRPVFAGETIHYTSTLTAKRKSASREGWGIITNTSEGALADGTKVLSMEGSVLIPTS